MEPEAKDVHTTTVATAATAAAATASTSATLNHAKGFERVRADQAHSSDSVPTEGNHGASIGVPARGAEPSGVGQRPCNGRSGVDLEKQDKNIPWEGCLKGILDHELEVDRVVEFRDVPEERRPGLPKNCSSLCTRCSE